MSLKQLKSDLKEVAQPEKVPIYQNFFKTGPGQYGQGDIFIGVTVPNTRKVAKAHSNLPLKEVESLLKSKIHEERLCALLLLVHKYNTPPGERKKIVSFYLKNTKLVNNWDLVDLSADKILGPHFIDQDKSTLYKLANSKNLWEKRISILTTFHFIKNNQFTDTLKIAKILLNDKHDLIHKAIGWMLREIGNRSLKTEESFLKKHYKKMPRTMLRYAIEKFPETKRQAYLKGKI
tara:strand:+ start:1939 stop:2640 length:702 start_codon:yes stop_codon:yes gene_type:complete